MYKNYWHVNNSYVNYYDFNQTQNYLSSIGLKPKRQLLNKHKTTKEKIPLITHICLPKLNIQYNNYESIGYLSKNNNFINEDERLSNLILPQLVQFKPDLKNKALITKDNMVKKKNRYEQFIY